MQLSAQISMHCSAWLHCGVWLHGCAASRQRLNLISWTKHYDPAEDTPGTNKGGGEGCGRAVSFISTPFFEARRAGGGGGYFQRQKRVAKVVHCEVVALTSLTSMS